ncbi:hypothetical protein E4T47_02492 [Aureobasidium subglaciale]|nr:hypothetical protein E4T47_02492 [Aureobasidium subglaciale]
MSDHNLDTVCLLDRAADLDKVKAKINADPERYTFGNRPNESKEASKPTNKDVFITLHNASHPVLVREHLDSFVLERMIVEFLKMHEAIAVQSRPRTELLRSAVAVCKATVAEAKSKQEGGGRVKGLNVTETWR